MTATVAPWHAALSPEEKAAMARATMLKKAELCDSIARLYPRGLKPFEVAHFRGTGVLPHGIDCPKAAASHWRGLAAT